MAATVIYPIGVSSPITPAEPLPPLPEILRGALVVVKGRAPIRRHSLALHHLHASPAAAIEFRDPRLGAVVVAAYRAGVGDEVGGGYLLESS